MAASKQDLAQTSFSTQGDTFSMSHVLKAAALYDLKCGAEDQSLGEDLGLEISVGANGTLQVQESIVAGVASRKPENSRSAGALEKIERLVRAPLASDRASSTVSTASEIGTDEGIDLESLDDSSSEAEQKSTIKCSENVETLICNPVLIQISEECDYSNDVRFLALLDALLPCIKSD